MGNHSSKPTISPRDKVILDLKVQRDKLKKYQIQLEAVLKRETEVARLCAANGDKRRALLALKKKNFQQDLLKKTDLQIANLEELTQTIEFSLVQAQLVEGLKAGNQVLAQLNKELNLDQVEKLMDDTHEAIEYQKEIDAYLTQGLSEEERQDIERELDALVAAEMEEKLPEVPTAALPQPVIEDVGIRKEKKHTQEEEDEAELVPA